LVGRVFDSLPVGLEIVGFEKIGERPQQARAVDVILALAGGEIVDEGGIAHPALAIGRRHRELLVDAKAGNAGELEEIAAVAGLGDLGDAADAADLVEVGLALGSGMRRVGLDHADQAVSPAQGIIDHREIARFENVERHLPARQQQRARQWKDRDHVGEVAGVLVDRIHGHRRPPTAATRPDLARLILALRPAPRHAADQAARQENKIDDSRLRPLTVASSVGPQASKNWTSCLRAPSSFHLRSRLTISSRLSTASWRRPLAFNATARSKRAWWSRGLAATFCSRS